jgi:hypothetical protein
MIAIYSIIIIYSIACPLVVPFGKFFIERLLFVSPVLSHRKMYDFRVNLETYFFTFTFFLYRIAVSSFETFC